MKRLFTFFVTLCVVASVGAYTTINGINYDLNEGNSTATLSSSYPYQCYSGDLVIPSSVTYNNKTYTVTGTLKTYTFKDCTGLTSVVIPGTINSISNYAFYGCTSLTSVVMEEGVSSISLYAFYGCSSLESIFFDGSFLNLYTPLSSQYFCISFSTKLPL